MAGAEMSEGVKTVVLVATADADYRLLVRLALGRDAGVAVVLTAADVTETFALAVDHHPDVLLLDASLAGGFAMLPKLLTERTPKVVIVSSGPPDELTAVAAAVGAVGYLGKDLAPSELPAAVGDVMRVVDRIESLVAKSFGRLPADPRSTRDARRLVRRTLVGWCDDEQLDAVALCVSELVTNAVVHAGSAPRILVHVRPPVIHVEISDDSDAGPVVRGASTEDTSGRGVSILSALSDRWGWRRRSGGGKTVWFDVVGALGPAARRER